MLTIKETIDTLILQKRRDKHNTETDIQIEHLLADSQSAQFTLSLMHISCAELASVLHESFHIESSISASHEQALKWMKN